MNRVSEADKKEARQAQEAERLRKETWLAYRTITAR